MTHFYSFISLFHYNLTKARFSIAILRGIILFARIPKFAIVLMADSRRAYNKPPEILNLIYKRLTIKALMPKNYLVRRLNAGLVYILSAQFSVPY